jgi:hypothetical protein
MKNRENWLIIMFASAYLSISIFEAVLILFLLYEIYLIAKRQIKLNGHLKLPLFMIITPSILSSAIYGKPHEIIGALNQTFFNITYFAKDLFTPSYKLFKKVNYTIVLFCTIEAVVTIYNYSKGLEKPIWGGVFEIGIIFALGSLSSFTLFLLEKDIKRKIIFFMLFILFTFLVFVTGKRNPILGILASYFVYFVILLKISNISKKWIYGMISVFLILSIGGTYYAVQKFPKYKLMFEFVFQGKDLTEEQLNEFSSARWEIGKKGVEVIKKDIENRNILPLLIGHGYAAGERLEPPSPVGRSYESIFLISELINIGLIGLIGIIFLMYRFFKFVITVKLSEFNQIVGLPFLVFPSYFLVGGIFSGMWDAILPLYFLMFGIAENYYSAIKQG